MSRLTLSHLSKDFDTDQVLKDISLDIASGEMICILGPTGSGKTTLLRLIAGLATPTRGKILMEGKNVTKLASHTRNIGMVFQSLALFAHLNVGDNVGYGLRQHGVARAKIHKDVAALLDEVGLHGLAGSPLNALTGGQHPRVALARALALVPAVLLLDDPFAGLDPPLRDQLQLEVARIQRARALACVFATPNHREALALADRIVVLHDGRVEQVGRPEVLYARPKTRFVAELFGTNNIFEVDLNDGRPRIGRADLGPATGPLKGLSGQCSMAVRPEAISLNRDSSKGLRGRITLQRRRGAMVMREIRVGDQTVVQTGYAGQGGTFEEGDAVALQWRSDAAWVLTP